MEIENIDKLANDYAAIKCNNHFAYQTAVEHFKSGYEKAIEDAIELLEKRASTNQYLPHLSEGTQQLKKLIDQLNQLIK